MISAAELFAPELALGVDALTPEIQERLRSYFADVLRVRGFPLHTAIAWNALHFGYDPEAESYNEVLLGANMPTIELGARGEAVPVGALCWLQLGGHGSEVWAEVVGKEGRPPGVEDDGVAPADLAGRRTGPDDVHVSESGEPVAVLDEALVCDFATFGKMPDLETKLERLVRRGRLDRHRLVEVRAEYRPAESAEDSDLGFYARWLFERQRDLLWNGPLGQGLVERDDEALQAALIGSLQAVDLLLTSVPGVVRWGDYALLSEWVEDIDAYPNLPLHRNDLSTLMVSMVRSRAGETTYTAFGRRLEEVAGPPASHPGRPDAPVVDPLEGVEYLRVMASAGRWIADRVDATAGVVGDLGSPRLLRVDDMWACGGLWRADDYTPGHPLAGIPADEPLGLGARGWAPLAQFLEVSIDDLMAMLDGKYQPPAPPDEESAAVADQPHDEAEEDDLESTFAEAAITLRQVDVDSGTLPVRERFPWITDEDEVSVLLAHDGDIDTDQRAQAGKLRIDEFVRRVEGISWPVDFFAGIRLHTSALVGGRTLFVASLPLPVPIVENGIEYRFVFDPDVVGRPAGDVEFTLTSIAIAALSRHGRLASDGTRRATASDVCGRCFGDLHPSLLAAITEVLDAAVRAGRLGLAGSEYTWTKGQRALSRRLTPTGWEPRVLRHAEVRVHWVPGFLRYLPSGYQASNAAQERYAADRAAGFISGSEWLPPGMTYVSGFERGSKYSAYTAALSQMVSSVDGRHPTSEDVNQLFEVWETE